MSTSTNESKPLNNILAEIQSLRRELALFLPTESIDDYQNKEEILSALKKARQ